MDDTRERVAALEVEVRHLANTVQSLNTKVNEIHTLLTQARGAQRAVGYLVAFGGSSVVLNIATNYTKIIAFFRGVG